MKKDLKTFRSGLFRNTQNLANINEIISPAKYPLTEANIKLRNNKKIKNTEKIYLMTTNKKLFYSQMDFKEVNTQNLLVREI